MKAIITTTALISTLIAGTVSAAGVDQGHLGLGTAFETASHYSNQHQVSVDAANLPSNLGHGNLYGGSK